MSNKEAFRNTNNFINFISNIKERIPQRVNGSIIDGHVSESVQDMWNKLGSNYLHQESIDALAATMYLLQENGIDRIDGSKSRWLSIGSGPALYEFSLAKQLNRLRIDNLDISIEQLKTAKHISYLLEKNSVSNESLERVSLVNASMDTLPFSSGKYDRVLVLNSLHWCVNWKGTVKEINRVLSPKMGSKVYAVIGSAAILTAKGKMTTTKDLDQDTFVDEFERNGLFAKHLIEMKIMNGQLGRPTKRFFGIFERGVSLKHWSERMVSGQIKFGEITVHSDGSVERKRFNG